MKPLKRTGFEFLVLGIIGLIVATAANGVRAKGSITLGKNYFYNPTQIDPRPVEHDPEAQNQGATTAQPEHAKHDFQKIDYKEVAALFDDPDTQAGLNVFLDARNDHSYEEGHIPGAVQCDPYQVDQYWDNAAPLLEGAMKIVVYCGGGDCDDSIFMCRELENLDIPREAIFLFEGGWKEWTANESPVETGRPE